MKKQILSWVLALSLLLTMLPVSAMAAEDELAGDGLSVTESTQCTCGAELDADGAIVHQEGCPLYEAPTGREPPEEDGCTCGAEPDETGTIAHADGCPLYEAPACTCGAEPNEAGTVTHADGCPLYEAPVCTCGAEPDETGAVTHADGCPLYEAPVCTCGAEPNADGVMVHQEGCPLYEALTVEEPPAEDGCTCGAEPDADGVMVHQEGCPLYEAPAVEEPPVEEPPVEEPPVEEPPVEEPPVEEPGLDAPGFSSMGEPALLTTTAEHGTHTGWMQLYTSSTINGGNYYLSSTVTTNSNITVSGNVTLCLNSNTLNIGQNTTFTVSSGATLTICDCGSGGAITGTESRINLNVISVTGSTLNLESGTISGTTTGSGSLISVTDGELNVTGGTISLNHTGKGTQLGVQAVELSNSTGSFTGGKVSLTTAVDNNRATTVYQEGGSVTMGGSAEIVFDWTTGANPNATPGSGALGVTQNGSVTVKDHCTISALRTDNEMAGAVSIGMLGDKTGTATITGGGINGALVVYGAADISNGSFDVIQNWGTLTMTGGTVENNIDYGILTNVKNGETDLSNVTIKSATGIYVSTGLGPTIGNGVIIDATQYGVDGSATLVGAPVIEGSTADLYIYSMRATTDYPSVDATAYTGGALTVQERKFPDAHQGGYTGCAIKVPKDKASLFSLENSASNRNFVYQYDEASGALRLYNQNAHPICGASCDHGDASHSDPAWQQWSTPSNYTLTGGSYYLTGTVTLSQPIVVTGDVNLCLNGNTIKRSDGSSPFQVTDGGSLTICDCQTSGQLTGGITATGGHIGIYGGTISGGAYPVDLGGNATLTLAGGPALSGTSAALKLYTKSGTTLENAAVDATGYTGGSLEVEENDVPGGANGFAIQGGEGKFSLKNPSGGYRYAYESGGYVIRPDHTHSYTYSGSGAVITETCTCNHSATATISIRADADLTYTGSAIEPAEVTYSDGWQGGKDLTITYSDNINAGTATATITKDNATASVTFTIEKANQTPPTASEYSIDYFHETITSIASGCKVYTAQTDGTEVAAGSLISDYLGGNLYILREETNNYHASGWETIPLAPRPAAPTVAAEPETIKDKGDGKVTGVDTTMEYSTDNGQNWTPCTGAEITGLDAGTAVLVRVKATSSAPHGEAASCTIEASENTLTVTFEENGGSAVTDITGLAYNVAISAPAGSIKTGYIFVGWYKEASCTNLWDFSSDKVTDDITLYAKWTPAAYSITYHLDGGTVSDNPETYTVETDSFTLNNPTRTGYTFAGWTGTGLDEATESVTIEKGSTGDRTYTATWTANTYTVAFDQNADDAAGEMTAQTFAYGQKQVLTANAFTRTGYTFSGWNTEADGSGTMYSDQQEVENLSATDGAAITLYAQWTANSNTAYTVQHWQQNLNGGNEHNDTNYTLTATKNLTGTTGASVTPAIKFYDGFTAPGAQTVSIAADGSTEVNYYYTRNSYTVTLTAGTGIASVSGDGAYQYGASVTISATVSNGYKWSMWSDSNTDQEHTFTMGAEDISLTAQATPISYTITYDLGGGTVSGNPASYTVETDSFTLESPTRTGYTFAGWTGTDITGTSSTVTIPKGSTGDRTYTATWTANTYAITYAGMGGAQHGEDHPTTHTYDTDTLVPNPTKDGYAFAGWQINGAGDAVKDLILSGTGYTSDITLTAQWTLDTPAVELTADKNSVTYGETITLTATAAYTADGLTYTYQWYKDGTALSGKTESTLTLTDVADSGSYHVAVTASDSSLSSTVSSTPVAVEIKPLDIAVTWSGLTRVYGDNEPEVKAVLGGVLGNDACTLSTITYQQGDTSVATPDNAGEYTVTVSLTGVDAVNYTLKNGTATLTIRPKPVGFTVSNNAVEGDGTTKTATVTPTDNNLTQTGYTVTYRQGTATVAAPTAVGSYEIWVEITDGNYQHTNGKTEMQVGTLTITQAPPVLYTVTFAGGEEADGTAPDALSAVANAKIILPESTFTRTNYQFTGWLYNGKVYQPGDSFTMPAQNVTFTAQWRQTYGITITVQEPKPEGEGTQTVSGAVVSLWLGANKLDEQTTNSDGEYTFAELLPGIYNLVVTKDERTVTSMVEITTSDVGETATLPKGVTNSIVKVTEGSPDIVVGNLDTVFHQEPDNTVYTEKDQETVEAGGKVEFTFTADEKQMGESSISDDMDKIEENKDTAVTVGLVMDYTLKKEVFDENGNKDEDASKRITQSNVLLEIRLPLPTELQGKDSYSVYRVHEDQPQQLGQGANNANDLGEYFTVSSDKTNLTLYVKCFSTYAIGYTESSGDNGGGSSGGGTSTPVYPPSIEEPEHGSVTISPKNPGKGDQVTITPTPDDGYAVDTLIVTDSNGKEVSVTPNDDGTYTFVQPSGKVTITVTFRQLASVSDCPRDESCPMAPFTDADRNAWYHDGVHYCVEHGLMTGTSQTTFAPDIVTTRGMIVTILWRLEGSPIVGASLDYDDVEAEDWYGEAVRWADSVGVVTGYGNGRFGPNDTITREQMATMLWRYAGSPRVDGSLSSFTDGAQTSSWAQPAMIWAVEQGLITGVGNDRLEPRGQATRAQAATILMRFAQNMAQ